MIEDCPSQQILLNWTQGILPEDQANEVSDHLDTCGTCDSVVSQAQGLSSISRIKLAASFLQEAECHDLSHLLKLPDAVQPESSHRRYELKDEIARGGMGLILKGRDRNLGRDLAIKVLLGRYNDNPEVVQRFVDEALIGGQLQHPGIAPVYELGQLDDQRRFFAMKLVKGQTLSQLLKERVDVAAELSRFVGVFEQICQTMAYAHSRNVIHRDLKPSNIMVGAFGEVQVMDWGLAKVIQRQSEVEEEPSSEEKTVVQTRGNIAGVQGQSGVGSLETQVGSVIGTLAYMPPEQALGETDQVDERADVFGLGAILCRILTGQPPYVPDSRAQMFVLASQGKLQDCFERLDTCGADSDLVQIAKDCLQADRHDRPRTAGAVADRVTKHVESAASKLQKAEVDRAAETARADSELARRRISLALAASVLLLFAAAAAGWMYTERQESIRLAADAEAERASAVTAKEAAEAAEEQGRQLLYATDMKLTPLLWKDPGVTLSQLRRRLDAHDPQTNLDLKDKVDLRGFEWHYYDNLLKNSSAVFGGHEALVLDARVNGGSELVTLTERGRVCRWDLFSRQEDASERRELSDGESIGQGVLSQDGQRAAVFVSQSKVVRVCDTSTGQLIWQRKTDGLCDYLSFSENGEWLIVVDRKVQWLEATTGDFVGVYQLASESTRKAALSRDGRTLAITNDSRKIQAYRLDEQQQKAMLTGRPVEESSNGTQCLAVTPDGSGFVDSIHNDSAVRTCGFATGGRLAANTKSHTTSVSAIAFLGGGPQIATAETAGTIRIWPSIDALMSGVQPTKMLKGHLGRVHRLTQSADSRYLVSISVSEGVRVWDLQVEDTGIHRLPGSFTKNGVQFSPDGRLIVTSTDDRIQIWDATTMQRLKDWQVTDKGAVSAIAWSPGDQNVLAIGFVNTGSIQPDDVSGVSLWAISTETELCRLAGLSDLPDGSRDDQRSAIGALTFSPDGKSLIVGFGSPLGSATVDLGSSAQPFALNVWDVETRQIRQVLDGHTHFCREFEFTADGATMASCGGDGTLILWSTETWKPKHILNSPDFRSGKGGADFTSSVESLSFSPDGKILAMARGRANVHLWDVSTGVCVATLQGHSRPVESVAFSPDGRTLASGSRDGDLRLWHVVTRQELFQLNDDRLAGGLSFSPDGSKLLGAGHGGVAFWSSVPKGGAEPE